MKHVLLIFALLLSLSGCQSASHVRSYRVPGSSTSLRIEMLQRDAVPIRYELQIDGAFVVEVGAADVIERPVATMHKGRRIELRGIASRGGAFTIVVFVDAERAGSFDFQT